MRLVGGITLEEEDYIPKVSDVYEDANTYWGDAWWDINEDYKREEYERKDK